MQYVKFRRPANLYQNAGEPRGTDYIGMWAETACAWAPSTERDADTHTDIWVTTHKITVAEPFATVERVMVESQEAAKRVVVEEG